jgi:hypothetical protein
MKKPIYFHENLFVGSVDRMQQIVNNYNKIADVWQAQKILPELNKERFEKLIEDEKFLPALFRKQVENLINEKLGKGLHSILNESMFELKLPASWSDTVKAIKSPIPQSQYITDTNLITFEKGRAVLAPDAIETLRSQCEVKPTPDNLTKKKLLEDYIKAYNELVDFMHKENHRHTTPDKTGLIEYKDHKASVNWQNFL